MKQAMEVVQNKEMNMSKAAREYNSPVNWQNGIHKLRFQPINYHANLRAQLKTSWL